MLGRQRLHQARRSDDPQRHGQSEERLREAEHRRGLHRGSAGEWKQEAAQRFEEERGDHHRPETPSRRERPRERGPEDAARAERMAAMKTADTRKPTASQSIAIGAVRACTRMPPSDGPATCATAFEACNRLFAATRRVRPTSDGTNAARARSVATANAPPRND